MNSRVFNEIIQLNKEFYERVAENFSKTRQNPWDGWGRMLEILKKQANFTDSQQLKILDIGCGNGRFLRFLEGNKIANIEYLGVDSSQKLLDLAARHYDAGIARFENHDAVSNLSDIKGSFDLIFAFGIVHHIPSFEFRQKWFADVFAKLSSNGIFVFTTWNYDRDSRFSNAVKSIPGKFNESDMEPGDYFIGWDKLVDVYRYVHIYSNSEIDMILNSLSVKLLSKFSADGKNGQLNDYYLISK